MVAQKDPIGVMICFDPMLAVGATTNDVPPVSVRSYIKRDQLNKAPFRPLPLTARLGLPLNFFLYDSFGGLGEVAHGYRPRFTNWTLALLSLDCDPDSDSFGEPLYEGFDELVLARDDGKDLDPEHVVILETFIRSELGDLEAYGKTGMELESEAAMAAKEKAIAAAAHATPESLEAYFSTSLETKIKIGGEEFKGLKSPLYDGPPGCYHCGETEGTDGMKLMVCAKCKERKYCGVECQKKDWKRHKGECKNRPRYLEKPEVFGH